MEGCEYGPRSLNWIRLEEVAGVHANSFAPNPETWENVQQNVCASKP
jgi:hypothetical protein